MKNRKAYLIIMMLVAGIMACEGPAGPEGPRGPQGEQGEQGIQGDEGPEGTANVMYTDWIEVEWPPSAVSSFSFDTTNANLTEEVLNGAAILSWGRISTDTYIEIPFVFSNRSYYTVITSASTNPTFRLRAVTTDGGTSTFGDFSDIRYVIIPGGVAMTKLKGSVDIHDYHAVMNYFGIEP